MGRTRAPRHVLAALAAWAAAGLAGAGEAVPAPGTWDGVTASARLDRPYEDPRQATVPFGLLSFVAHPWRSYMDTWPARRFLGAMGFAYNVQPQQGEAVCQLMAESGIRQVRFEIGWGNLDWDGGLSGTRRDGIVATLQLFRRHGLRPLILLNSHHAVPCPVRRLEVELLADAKQGERSLRVKDASAIRAGYTGPMDVAEYCAAKPLITAIAADGTCQLSMPLPRDMKAGTLELFELKYLPLQGTRLADGTPVPEAQATVDGWLAYVQTVAELASDTLGTRGQADAGFDVEVWNELTFGSNFLDLNRYYADKRAYAEPLHHRRTRPLAPGLRPDAKKQFEASGFQVLHAVTCDFFSAAAATYPGVTVVNGFDNQWPWDSGTDSWDGQGAISRHYYLGGWRDIAPGTVRGDLDSIDALGQRAGRRPEKPIDWYDIVPGSNFVPTLREGLPELGWSGFKTESIARDVMPDSRLTGMGGHGRYTHNGGFRPVQVFQTEFNYGRQEFWARLFQETGAKRDDPRAYALDAHQLGKFMLRSYLFQNHRGLDRLYLFAPGEQPFGINMLTPPFFTTLEASAGVLTPAVRATVPSAYAGLAWLTRTMETGEVIAAPRQLRVETLVEYKPRLMYAGDGTPRHPHQWNRDWFTVMPYQLAADRFVIPYYVMTVDVNHVYDATRDAFDPARYAMPEQDFDLTIGNCRGPGATVEAYDPLTNQRVPVTAVAATRSTLTVRLKAVDYPRILLLYEEAPGIQILAPRTAVDAQGRLTVSWRSNRPAGAATVTYGHDWQQRGARTVELAPGRDAYEVAIPTGLDGVLAARITVQADGLTAVWPRWDEDTAGQVVVPGSAAAAPAPATVAGPAERVAAPAVPLAAPAGITLPLSETDTQGRFALRLPASTILAGAAGERSGRIGGALLQIRCVAGADDALPFRAVGDEERRQAVTLPGGAAASLVELLLLGEAHPGMSNLAQRHLLVPLGDAKAGLLAVSVSGGREVIAGLEPLLRAVFASVTIPPH